jgi:ATP-dependent exoDNAse (exonuclease V) alpha subunit
MHKQTSNSIELNEQFKQALNWMEDTNKTVFVTGRAGTGKSTLLNHFRNTTKKRAVVLAPTGVAAINVKGQTIHSFFGFKPNITIQSITSKHKKYGDKNIYKKLDAIVIDEISMVRADLLDCVDKFLRLNGPDKNTPFGGIQMIFIGDLYQLPPIVNNEERDFFRTQYRSPYFFSANAMRGIKLELIELEKIYRQKDQKFINILNAIRNNTATEKDLETLNKRYNPEFLPNEKEFFIYLTAKNLDADKINEDRLSRLKTKQYVFTARKQGDFGREYMPTSETLKIKEGAQIMMLNNEQSGNWVNGTIGKVLKINKGDDGENIINATLENGKTVDIHPHTWEIFKFSFEDGKMESDVAGTFTQYPLRLSWAVTVHKAQGKTFHHVILDIATTFAHGQMYVALSRCTTLEGMVLKRLIKPAHVKADYQVAQFLTQYHYDRAREKCPVKDKETIIKNAIANKQNLEIVYLKASDIKSHRLIKPKRLGEMEYLGYKYRGLKAICLTKNEERIFKVDRILEIKVV